MTTTANMGLTKPVKATDLADVNVLNTNSDLIDAHDHTGGKGAQISGSGIADGSITNQKLATGIDGGKISGAVAEASHALAADLATNATDAADSDMVDGCHAGTAKDNVLKLDGNGRVPIGNMPVGTTLGLKELWIYLNADGGGITDNNVVVDGWPWIYTAANYPTPITATLHCTVSSNKHIKGGLYNVTDAAWVESVEVTNGSTNIDKVVVLTTGKTYKLATQGMDALPYSGGDYQGAIGYIVLTW